MSNTIRLERPPNSSKSPKWEWVSFLWLPAKVTSISLNSSWVKLSKQTIWSQICHASEFRLPKTWLCLQLDVATLDHKMGVRKMNKSRVTSPRTTCPKLANFKIKAILAAVQTPAPCPPPTKTAQQCLSFKDANDTSLPQELSIGPNQTTPAWNGP